MRHDQRKQQQHQSMQFEFNDSKLVCLEFESSNDPIQVGAAYDECLCCWFLVAQLQ
ncbi:MAG: hypothetical protein ACI90V_010558, partial [Bacillariaceae sp.]